MTDIVDELLDFTTRDHERGCTGREYVCSCGYDQDIEAAVKKAAYEIERLRVVLSTARVDGMVMAAKHHEDAVTRIRNNPDSYRDGSLRPSAKRASNFHEASAVAIRKLKERAGDPIKGMTYMQTEYGKPFSVKGLGNRVSDWFTQAGLPHCTAHSVRKGLATDQAHNEATDSMLEAMFGWKDGKTSKIYTRNAERARLARQAVARINWDGIGTKLLASEG